MRVILWRECARGDPASHECHRTQEIWPRWNVMLQSTFLIHITHIFQHRHFTSLFPILHPLLFPLLDKTAESATSGRQPLAVPG